MQALILIFVLLVLVSALAASIGRRRQAELLVRDNRELLGLLKDRDRLIVALILLHGGSVTMPRDLPVERVRVQVTETAEGTVFDAEIY